MEEISRDFIYLKEICTLLMGFTGLVLLYRRVKAADDLVETNNRISYETAFSNAIKLFESDNVDARMGALDSLQRISKEFPKYRDQVLEVCFRFIRNNSNEQIRSNGKPREDIKKILEIFRERPIISKTRAFNPYSLNSSYLSGADLKEISFNAIDFSKTNLEYADLRRSIFERCDFSNSFLLEANFSATKLSGATFLDSDLSFTDFDSCDLKHALFSRAILIGTKFNNIDIENFPIVPIVGKYNFKFLEMTMICHEGNFLANDPAFLDNDEYTPDSFFDRIKSKMNNFEMKNEHLEIGYFDTKFPDYIRVIPDLKNKPKFKLEWVDTKTLKS